MKLVPPHLAFDMSFEEPMCRMKLINDSDEPKVFAIRTTNLLGTFLFNPTRGLLKPKESITFEVVIRAQKRKEIVESGEFRCRDEFVIVSETVKEQVLNDFLKLAPREAEQRQLVTQHLSKRTFKMDRLLFPAVFVPEAHADELYTQGPDAVHGNHEGNGVDQRPITVHAASTFGVTSNASLFARCRPRAVNHDEGEEEDAAPSRWSSCWTLGRKNSNKQEEEEDVEEDAQSKKTSSIWSRCVGCLKIVHIRGQLVLDRSEVFFPQGAENANFRISNRSDFFVLAQIMSSTTAGQQPRFSLIENRFLIEPKCLVPVVLKNERPTQPTGEPEEFSIHVINVTDPNILDAAQKNISSANKEAWRVLASAPQRRVWIGKVTVKLMPRENPDDNGADTEGQSRKSFKKSKLPTPTPTPLKQTFPVSSGTVLPEVQAIPLTNGGASSEHPVPDSNINHDNSNSQEITAV